MDQSPTYHLYLHTPFIICYLPYYLVDLRIDAIAPYLASILYEVESCAQLN